MEYIKNYWYHDCKGKGDKFIQNENVRCENCTNLKPYAFNVDGMKRVYNWFHFAFPNFKNNEICTNEDIVLRNNFEGVLTNAGE